MSEHTPAPAEEELLELQERLARAIRETKEAAACSQALREKSQELRRHAREVLRRSALRRYALFNTTTDALAELDALSKESDNSS